MVYESDDVVLRFSMAPKVYEVDTTVLIVLLGFWGLLVLVWGCPMWQFLDSEL